MTDRETRDHLTDDAVVDLSLGLLPGSEETRILDHAERCAACAGLLRRHLGDAARLRSRRDRNRKVVDLPRRWVLGGGVAAAALAAVLALVVLPRGDRGGWLPVPPVLVTRGTDSTATEPLRRALEAYAERDTRTAILRLEAWEAPPELRPVRDCYLGSALYHDGRIEEAERVLTPLVESGALPQPWRDRAESLLDRIRSELP